jgi:hypothetical protein
MAKPVQHLFIKFKNIKEDLKIWKTFMKNLNGVSLWQCKWHELLDFQLFTDVSNFGINACIFQKKFCMKSFDQICRSAEN